MSLGALQWAFSVPMKSTRKAVLLTLAYHANEEGECWPRVKRIAQMSGCSLSRIYLYLREFEQHGLISRHARYGEQGDKRANLYCLHIDKKVAGKGNKQGQQDENNSEEFIAERDEGHIKTGSTYLSDREIYKDHTKLKLKEKKKENKEKDISNEMSDMLFCNLRNKKITDHNSYLDDPILNDDPSVKANELSSGWQIDDSSRQANELSSGWQIDDSSRQANKLSSGQQIDDPPRPANKLSAGRQEIILAVFDHWRSVMGYAHAKLDDKRKRRIKAALQWGYSDEELLLAIDGCSKTPFNIGQNERAMRYDTLDIILRDADHIDRFIRQAKTPSVPSDTLAAVLAMEAQLQGVE